MRHIVDEQGEGRHIVQVGRPVEIRAHEALALDEYSHHMRRVSRRQRKGWFLEYLRAHKASHEVIKTIIQRSHAT